MPTTYPNQRTVKIHREVAKSDFLGIKNSNWQAAARDLRAQGLLLYLYLASNADNYTLALSPAAVREAIGMPRSTYADQFQLLLDRGYLVPKSGNTYDFYEIPKPRNVTQIGNDVTSAVYDDTLNTNNGQASTAFVIQKPQQEIQINNSTTNNKYNEINIDNESTQNPKAKVTANGKEFIF